MPSGIMDLLTTPTSFPLELDWECKMEPTSPSGQSQLWSAEDLTNNDDAFNDYYYEDLFDKTIIETDVKTETDPSALLKEDVLLVTTVSKQETDPWYDDKLKLPCSGLAAQLGGYAPLPTVIEDGSFALQPEKTNNAATEELLMEFDCVYENVELMNHLTPPQTPPQSSAFGGVGGCVVPIQQPLQQLPVPVQQLQQQQLLQQFYAPLCNTIPSQQQQPQQLSFQGTGPEYYIEDEYATMTQLGLVVQQQALPQPLQQVPVDIGPGTFSFSSEQYTQQQMIEVESIVRSLQMSEEALRAGKDVQQPAFNDDDDSCGFSEAGSVGSGDSSSLVSRSPAYSDSAESSYYGCQNDRDDDDWSPAKKVKKLNLTGGGGGAVTKKRTTTGTRPYGRGTEDKKSRKKEQNKNAATRYRQKKKAETEEVLVVEQDLRNRNELLSAKSTDLAREIRCIKKLLREFLCSKGVI